MTTVEDLQERVEMTTVEDLKERLEKLSVELQSREVYFPPKEKKIKPFNGMDGESVDDFVEDVRAGLNLRRLRGERAVEYVNAHLEGAARQEIKHRPAKEKCDADSILQILLDTFGERLTLGQLMRKVYNRTQRGGESVSEFAYALLSLRSRMEAKSGSPDAEKAIKEQFQDGLSDPVLRRDVKRLVKEQPRLPFLDVRNWAIEMEEGERDTPVNHRKGAVRQAEASVEFGSVMEGLTVAIRSQTDVLQRMQDKQEEFNARLQRLEERRDGSSGRRPPVDRRTVECYRCGVRGHYAKECPFPPGSRGNRQPAPGGQQLSEN